MLRSRSLTTAALLAAVLLATHAAHWLMPQLFEPLTDQLTDRLFSLRDRFLSRRPAYDPTVVNVFIDDQSLQDLGTEYLDRSQYAQAILNLGRAGVAAQFHDAVFKAPQDPVSDAQLIDATRQAGNAYFGMGLHLGPARDDVKPPVLTADRLETLDASAWSVTVRGDPAAVSMMQRPYLTFPALASASRGLGFLDVHVDRDGVYRRAPLLVRHGDRFVPALSLRVVCDVLGVPPERVTLDSGRSVTLGKARLPGDDAARDIVIPIDDRGMMIVNFIGPWGRMKNFAFSAVHDASYDRFMLEDLRAELQGKIAIVAEVTTGSGDIGPVPVDPIYPRSGIHANVVNSILGGEFLRALDGRQMLWLVEIPLLCLLLFLSLRLPTLPFLASALAVLLGYHLLVVLVFLYGNLILIVPRPVIFLVFSTIAVAGYHYHLESRERAVLRNTFNAFFPPSVVDKIMAQSDRLTLAAQKRELTILFSDIKSFTTHTSEMEASRVRRLLNEYFEKMIEIVFRHEGTLDKLIGDGLMVFFGDPELQPDHAARCVEAAVEMQRAARALDRGWRSRGEMPLQIRIGINTGEVIVGNMGSRRRLSYTVLGEPVNLAQRLESNAPIGGILISERTYELAGDRIEAHRREPIRVKGFDRSIPVYEVSVGED